MIKCTNTIVYKNGKDFAQEDFFIENMTESQIENVNTALKINSYELQRIKVRIEDNNRSIKNYLRSNTSEENHAEIQDLLKFNRFLFQKQNEKQVEKRNLESSFKSLLLSEMDSEQEWIEIERRMDCFRLTINKSIDFNESHPYFNDQTFLFELISEFENREDFEACAALSSMST